MFQTKSWLDAKKKEKIENYQNTGREYRKKKQPADGRIYDFADNTLGKVIPYRICDVSNNTRTVNVGVS